MIIRLLTAGDLLIWKKFRLEALLNSPESFASSYEEEYHWTELEFQTALKRSNIFAAFIENELIACAGFYTLNYVKTKHRGVVWGMYTRPEFRNQGIASAVLQKLIEGAKTTVSQLHLTCVTSNNSAVQFYQKQGFTIYGTEPRALKVDNQFYDEHLMIMEL